MKRVVLLSVVLVLTFNGCGGGKSSNTDNNQSGNNTGSTIYKPEGGEVVNGFTLPPYPDPTENDKTLLGIDTNNNGVRDDVERWLIFRYKDHHRIVTEIGFQGARAHQIVIQDPSKAKETYPIEDAAQFCNSYFRRYANDFGDPILIDHTIITSTAYKTMQFNTKERIKAYLTYDKALSGGVYRLPHASERKALCTFDVDRLLGE
jgi:hypothetical protein